MLIEWTEALAVGHPGIDADHREIIAIINRLSEAIGAGEIIARRHEFLVKLSTYVCDHFAREEYWMDKSRFPDAAAHIREHKQLIDILTGITFQFETAPGTLDHGVMARIRDWFVNHHLLDSDLRLGQHLRAWQAV